ncbi:O-antigen ligase family protein [Planococcus lenghuensis]|uniref:O-antigen ligase-related domain-containing protein n=1 Tax=Planococcus lenghuensis TaxID=2213202 RepID=A0A1Q2L1H8_9BACL|nr:O-antigen ligase family protein [Planococcus lenghuensis]AQQ54224.1 hypothetical protein B0X71_14710 [Planococcus lenghuensis]
MGEILTGQRHFINTAFLAVPLLLVFLYWYTGIAALYFAGAALLVIIFLSKSDIIAFCMLFALLPLENMLRMEGAPFSIVSVVIVLLFLKLFIQRKFKLDLVMFMMIVFMVFFLGLHTLVYSRLFDLDNLRFFVNIVYISSLFLVYKRTLTLKALIITKYFIFGTALLLLFSLIYTIFTLQIDLLASRLYGLREDPNYIAVMFSIATGLCLINLHQKRMNPILCNILMLFFMAGVLLTQSRGGLLAFTPNFFCYAYLMLKVDKRQVVVSAVVTLFLVYVTNQNRVFVDSVFENLTGRIDNADSDGGSGRLDIWMAYLHLYSQDIGQLLLGPHENVYPKQGSGVIVAHNLVLGAIAQSGGINLIFIGIAFVNLAKIIKDVSGVYGIYMIGLLPIVIMGAGYFFLDAVFINVFIYAFVLSLMIIYLRPELQMKRDSREEVLRFDKSTLIGEQ